MIRFLKVIFFFLFVSLHASPPKLLIKIPTRARSVQFFKVLDAYYAHLSGKIPFHFIITCDLDDPIMSNVYVRNRLKLYPNLSVFYGQNNSKIEAFNNDLEHFKDFDILLVGSDDMIPQIYGYDLDIVENMLHFFPDFDGVLHYNDGFTKNLLITYPILGKKYYDHFGYVFYPEYKGFFCDNELTAVSQILGKYVYFDKVLFEHQHPHNGLGNFDCLYEMNNLYFAIDKNLFFERQNILFDLPQDEILNPLH